MKLFLYWRGKFALRVVRAAEEIAIAALTFNQMPAALGADAVVDLVVLPANAIIHLVEMFLASVLSLNGSSVKYGGKALHFVERHYLLIVAINHVEKLSGVYDCTLCIAVEVCTVKEYNNRDEGVLRHAEEVGQSLDMRVVLLNRISEMVSIAVHILRPLVGSVVAIYPARVIFRLDDKDSVGRDNNVVNLYGITIALYHDVVPNVIFVGQSLQDGENPLLTTLSAILGLAGQ